MIKTARMNATQIGQACRTRVSKYTAPATNACAPYARLKMPDVLYASTRPTASSAYTLP